MILKAQILLLMLALLFSTGSLTLAQTPAPSVQVLWKEDHQQMTLGAWDLPGLPKRSHVASREKDPQTGQVVQWEGVRLSALVDSSLEKLPLAQRAVVDLIVLKGKNGVQAMIPRYFVNKYPVSLAVRVDHHELGERGPVFSVVPWTSQPKVFQESLPVETYFVAGVTEVDLTSSRLLYQSYSLKRRSDPRAVRGEKVLIRTCLGCHGRQEGSFRAKLLEAEASAKVEAKDFHASVSGMPKLVEGDLKALRSYLKAARADADKKQP